MNKHGGQREGAGRPEGSGNIASTAQRRSVAEIARTYADRSIETLAHLMENAEKESTRLAAAIAMLERGYGKPSQYVEQANTFKPEEPLDDGSVAMLERFAEYALRRREQQDKKKLGP